MSKFLKCVAVILSVVTLAITPSHAAADSWQVVEMEGAVRMAQPMATATPVSTGGALSAGAILSTGYDGRAVLVRGDQQIIVGPNSRMSLPAGEEPGMTRVLQDLGTLLFKVDKREKQHFRVETPVIAAVVKGTTFTVTAGADTHAVHVAEGAVEVSSRSGLARELVTAGRTAHISRSNPAVIEFIESAPRGEDSTPGKGVTPLKKASFERPAGERSGDFVVPAAIGDGPLDFATLTDGLVEPSDNGVGNSGAVNFARSNNVETMNAGDARSAIATVASQRSNANNNAARPVGLDNAATAQLADHNKAAANANGNGNSNSGNANANSNGNSNSGNANENSNSNSGKGSENSNSGKGSENSNNGKALGNEGKNSNRGNAANGNK